MPVMMPSNENDTLSFCRHRDESADPLPLCKFQSSKLALLHQIEVNEGSTVNAIERQ